MNGAVTTAQLSDALAAIAASGNGAGSREPTARPPAIVFDRPARGLAIRHLLVPMDGSALAECVLPFAAAIARVFSARITLLRILTAPGGHIDAVDWELVRAEAHRHLAQLERRLTESGLEVSTAVQEGRPAEQILHFCHESHVDLIVLSSHGEGGLTGWALSSTAQKVVARTHCSVLIVPAYATGATDAVEHRFGKVLLPLDCSPRAECVLPFAAALARAHDAELILAHVVAEPELPRRMPPSSEDVSLARRLTERNRQESEEYLGSVSDDLSQQRLRVRTQAVASTRRPHAIIDMAEREGVDLIIACAHGATGNPTDRYGSMAEHLLHGSSRPVVVLQDLAGELRESNRAAVAAQSHAGH
jgi:nucleotide-binding universal stress UspA family protein